jgi:hypothetical protein
VEIAMNGLINVIVNIDETLPHSKIILSTENNWKNYSSDSEIEVSRPIWQNAS